jgi:hypothetical protein
MEDRVTELAPQLAWVFFNADVFGDPDLLQSFRSTLRLAQQTAVCKVSVRSFSRSIHSCSRSSPRRLRTCLGRIGSRS